MSVIVSFAFLPINESNIDSGYLASTKVFSFLSWQGGDQILVP